MSSPPEKEQKKPAGQIRHDATGRAVWEWAKESGRHAIDSTSLLLKRLELPGLTLTDDIKNKPDVEPDVDVVGKSRAAAPRASSKQGFNPYETRIPPKRGAPTPAPKKPVARITQPVRPAKKPGFFARLFGKK